MMHNLNMRFEVIVIVKIHIVVVWVIAVCSMVDVNVLRNLTAFALRVPVLMLLLPPYTFMCTPLLNMGNYKVHVGMVSSVVKTCISSKSMQQFSTSNTQLDKQTVMVCHVCVHSIYIVQIHNM